MAVKISRGRYCVEFMQGGTRLFRRLPPGVTKRDAVHSRNSEMDGILMERDRLAVERPEDQVGRDYALVCAYKDGMIAQGLGIYPIRNDAVFVPEMPELTAIGIELTRLRDGARCHAREHVRFRRGDTLTLTGVNRAFR